MFDPARWIDCDVADAAGTQQAVQENSATACSSMILFSLPTIDFRHLSLRR